ncbi:T9SS type B sorting domain-containing protein [Lutibacter sp.]|uniref:T9SS type B sorting domain-containing protein n=1 Tax=Lutibacter sp. TaxID=1925666 RepID=UPI0025C1EB43|nr:T9SS type B sorting domain-containing protein [Lutibacter sp.]MCF6182695.1 T9SS type B sorting domain-containing protein [Lutibacter sp.]
MKRIVFFWIILLPILSFSQKEAAFWYFGQNAGLDFNSGTPVVLTNGKLSTLEGCATISDATGNLLFYTDGVKVWDKTGTIMPNGTGLLGNTSSTQSAIITPKPNNPNQFYIFSVDQRTALSALSTNGINYSLVDMSLNGGLGDLVTSQKDINLVSQAYEKITAVKNNNNNSIWIITFIQNQFLAWLVDAAGVNLTPVTSTVSFAADSRGYLKISPDGNKIACANFGNTHSMMLYDFDATTGIVSNEQELTFDDTNDIPYGVEFSTQSRKLYVTTSQLKINDHMPPGKLYQFDLMNGNNRTLIHTSNINTRGAVQLAIDGKIYRALSISGASQVGTKFLGIINKPEADGLACNYEHNKLDISAGDPNRKVVEGLPPFIQSYFLEPSISANNVCLGDVTQFNLSSSTTPTSITWGFGDPTSGTNNTSTLENPTHIFTSSGVFTVTATVTIGVNTSILTLDITIYDLPVVTSPVTLTKCDDNLDGIEDFNLNDANALISSESPLPIFTYFLTETDAIANINTIVNPTAFSNNTQSTVWARIENAVGCFTTAQVDLKVISIDIPNAFMLTYNQCDDLTDEDDTNGLTTFDFSTATNQVLNALLPVANLTVAYYETLADAFAETNAINPSNYTNTTAFTQQIVVRVDKTTDTCFGLGFHITLNVTPVPIFDLNPNITLCLSSSSATIGVENPTDNYDYLWTDSSGNTIGNTPQINVDTEDTYTVTATDTNGNNCQTSKDIQVIASPILPLPNFGLNNLEIIDNTSNNSITVNTNNLPSSNYEFSLDSDIFQTNNVFQTVSGGLHTVKIRDIENCLEASVQVNLISIPNFFTPNNDGSNDTWQVTGIDNQPNTKIYVFDRFGKLIAILNPLGNGWNGLYKGNPLPSTDYWYKVELEDGRVLRGHFSLIRK